MKVYELMERLSQCTAGDEVVFDSVVFKDEITVFNEEEGTVRVIKKIEELEDLGNGEVYIS